MIPSISMPYTPHYQEQCFEAWYSAGRPTKRSHIVEVIPEDEHGRKPRADLVSQWREELGWDARADILDAKAVAIVEDDLVNARVLMLKEQAAKARELQKLGMDYLREEGIDSGAAAISAIVRGAELERTSRGLSESLTKLLTMDNDKLIGTVQGLLDRASEDPTIVDASEVEEENESVPGEETSE